MSLSRNEPQGLSRPFPGDTQSGLSRFSNRWRRASEGDGPLMLSSLRQSRGRGQGSILGSAGRASSIEPTFRASSLPHSRPAGGREEGSLEVVAGGTRPKSCRTEAAGGSVRGGALNPIC